MNRIACKLILIEQEDYLMNTQKVGMGIKILRQRLGYSQLQLAEMLGVTDKAVSRWERGIGVPDISIITKLSILLNVDTDNLIEGNLVFYDHDWEGCLFLHEYENGINPKDYRPKYVIK